MGLKRPSNNVQTRANRLSGLRNEFKQRALPGAARPDPYDIPTTAEKPPRLRRLIDEAAEFSPIRKQKAARKVDDGETIEVSNDRHDARDSIVSSAQAEAEPMLRTSSRRAATAHLQPAEPSSGSTRRGTLPLVKPNAAGQGEGARSIDPAELHEAQYQHQVQDSSADPNAPPRRKRGRPRKSDSSSRPSKSPKLAKAPQDTLLPSKRRPGRSNRDSSGPTAAAQGSPRVKPVTVRLNELDFPTPAQHQEPEPRHSSELEGGVATATTKQPSLLKRALKPKNTRPAAVQERENFANNSNNGESANEESARDDEQPGNDEGGPATIETEADTRLLGYYETLKAVVKRARAVEKCAQGEEVDKEIRKMQRYCSEFVKALNEHRDRPQDVELLSDPPDQIQTIAADIRMLCGRDLGRPVDRESLTKSHNIYLRLMPALVRVLYALVECYQAVDHDTAPLERSVTIKHLETITQFITMFLELNTGAKQFVRPDTQLTAVQPFDRKIVPPLRAMRDTFQRHIKDHESLAIQRALNRHEQVRREAAERAEALERAEKARWALLETKWTKLHEERYHADESIKPLPKRRHLRQPLPEPEEDHNGHAFERVQVFRPRVGPPPAMVEKAKSQAWREESYAALMRGLQMWSGDVLVFERIFRMFCGRNLPLNAYNVTEIVVMAALVKRHLEETCDVDEREWWWVKRIPDWTRPHTVLEQLEAASANGGA
ncbi:hypothetical protein CERZMDRAFT_97571 [Cercospora zeae-maydis SCOH1-5]|uniref:Uncharacterized protein n=1 Tax=Cercospora zeae-maydis SCOH1-5 TaxID=717836 RepID=A0A6A6FG59_9PEZI|nr:hypothetical protein CERZMDRAFT_97571 [Cercospora zeae-maydis SCOH1-5]